jgi:hypothetical protein
MPESLVTICALAVVATANAATASNAYFLIVSSLTLLIVMAGR